MIKKWTKTITLEIEVDEKEYTASVQLSCHNESNHGADADGNRGESMDFLDDWDVDEIRDENNKVVDMTKDMYLEIHSKIYDVDIGED